MKACNKCGGMLPLDCFHANARKPDGRLNTCAACVCRLARERRAKNPERVRAVERKYVTSLRGREVRQRYERQDREQHPNKYSARRAVNNALQAGRLTRLPCKVCGSSDGTEAHHPDYGKPLEIVWLCRSHHAQLHAGLLKL